MSQLKYITNDIDALDIAEHELESKGVPRAHMHVLSNSDGELSKHDLPGFSDWSKRDLWHYGTRGALVGLALTVVIIGGGYAMGFTDPITWAALAFLAVVIMGFCTWEGGLIGVSKLNHQFAKYRDAIDRGEHLLVIDAKSSEEEDTVKRSVASKPDLRAVD